MEVTFKPSVKQWQAWEYLTDDVTTELGYGGAACLVGETEVLTENGYIQIKDVEEGQRVFSLNETTQEIELKEVLHVFKYGGCNMEQNMIQFNLYDGQSITCTPEHMFYVGGIWLQAQELRERILEIHRGNRTEIFNIDNGSLNNSKLEEYRERCGNETCDNKRYYFKEKLEARELDIDIIESVEVLIKAVDVYDLEVIDNNNFIITRDNLITHNSGGKSYLGCVWITTMCLAYPDTGWVIGRKELTNLKRTTLLTLFKVFKEFGIDDKAYNYNQQNNTITFGNGSQIFLLDLGYKPSDPLYTRLGGLEITGYFIDESNECNYEGIEILKTRTGRRNNAKYNLKPKGLESFNPSKNHVYQRYYKPWKEQTLPVHRKFIQALPQDNPYTTEDYIKQLQNSDTVTRMRLLEGNFEYDDDPATLMAYNNIVDIFTNTVQNRGEKYISVDVARLGKDSTVIMVWEDLKVIDIQVLTKTTLDVTAEKIRAIASEHRVPFSHIIIDEDGVGGGLVDMLGGVVGFVANSVPRKIETGIKDERPLNYRNLKSQCYFTLANFVNKHNIAIYDCGIILKEKIIEELEVVKQKDIDKEGKLSVLPKDEVKELLGRSPDYADALMMRMYFELGKPMNVGIKIPRHRSFKRHVSNPL